MSALCLRCQGSVVPGPGQWYMLCRLPVDVITGYYCYYVSCTSQVPLSFPTNATLSFCMFYMFNFYCTFLRFYALYVLCDLCSQLFFIPHYIHSLWLDLLYMHNLHQHLFFQINCALHFQILILAPFTNLAVLVGLLSFSITILI